MNKPNIIIGFGIIAIPYNINSDKMLGDTRRCKCGKFYRRDKRSFEQMFYIFAKLISLWYRKQNYRLYNMKIYYKNNIFMHAKLV